MGRRVLQGGLYFIGVAAILIGSAIALLGIQIVGNVFSSIINLFINAGPLTDLGHPNADSELRFYSVFFVAFGVLMVQSAQDLKKHYARIPILLAPFFAGGAARATGYVTIGAPHALFILLMIIELSLPPILWLAWRKTSLA